MENIESVKSRIPSNSHKCLIGNLDGFHDKENSQILYKSLQFVYKLKKIVVLIFHKFNIFRKFNYGKTRLEKKLKYIELDRTSRTSRQNYFLAFYVMSKMMYIFQKHCYISSGFSKREQRNLLLWYTWFKLPWFY